VAATPGAPGLVPVPVGISLAAPLERVHTFTLRGSRGLATISSSVELIVDDPSAFEAELTTAQLGAIAVDSLRATPYVAIRSLAHIEGDELGDRVYFGTLRMGRGVLAQGGRTAEQVPGSSAILRSSAPYRSDNYAATAGLARNHVILTTVPMTLLPGKANQLAQLTATTLPRTALVVAATSFLGTVSLGLPQPGSAAATFVEHAIVDLLLAVVAERTAELLPAEATEAGTRVRIRDFVLRRLPDSALGPQRIAAEFGISTRYLHRLFESEDTSVGSFIRRERLKKAATELTDPTLRHLDVKTIANRSGFAGADQFARAFKSRYGLSPRDYRRMERIDSGGSAANMGRPEDV
jgi:AraC-like DNA-binding protein